MKKKYFIGSLGTTAIDHFTCPNTTPAELVSNLRSTYEFNVGKNYVADPAIFRQIQQKVAEHVKITDLGGTAGNKLHALMHTLPQEMVAGAYFISPMSPAMQEKQHPLITTLSPDICEDMKFPTSITLPSGKDKLAIVHQGNVSALFSEEWIHTAVQAMFEKLPAKEEVEDVFVFEASLCRKIGANDPAQAAYNILESVKKNNFKIVFGLETKQKRAQDRPQDYIKLIECLDQGDLIIANLDELHALLKTQNLAPHAAMRQLQQLANGATIVMSDGTEPTLYLDHNGHPGAVPGFTFDPDCFQSTTGA
ncbi:MAG: hypothetical protein AAFY76_21460, partial [Cyanobacteria bacterium J06649_11]